MNNITALLQCIFLGDYGLLTLTPRYLFLVLFPVMVLLGLLGQILPRIPFLRETSPLTSQFFYCFVGLGCTTCALASLDGLTDPKAKSRMAWILVLLVPCSAKLTILAAFASMVSFKVFLVFLLFFASFSALLYFLIGRLLPCSDAVTRPESSAGSFSLAAIFRDAFQSALDTALPFCAGSLLISLAVYLGLLDRLTEAFMPVMDSLFGLPPEAAQLLFLGILKRDFGAASLLTLGMGGSFDAAQLTVTVLMMTFSPPCFNSAVLLVKQQRLPGAAAIWLGSLLVSLFIGKITAEIFFVCLL